jgi:hypothetical protein
MNCSTPHPRRAPGRLAGSPLFHFRLSSTSMPFKNTHPATRELVMVCIPALLAAAVITAALAGALWWSLKWGTPVGEEARCLLYLFGEPSNHHLYAATGNSISPR